MVDDEGPRADETAPASGDDAPEAGMIDPGVPAGEQSLPAQAELAFDATPVPEGTSPPEVSGDADAEVERAEVDLMPDIESEPHVADTPDREDVAEPAQDVAEPAQDDAEPAQDLAVGVEGAAQESAAAPPGRSDAETAPPDSPDAQGGASPPRRSRRATRGVTRVAFSALPAAPVIVEPSRPAAPAVTAVFQAPAAEDLAPRRSRRVTRPTLSAGAAQDVTTAPAPDSESVPTSEEPLADTDERARSPRAEASKSPDEQGDAPTSAASEAPTRPTEPAAQEDAEPSEVGRGEESEDESTPRRRRRRGGRRRRRQGGPGQDDEGENDEAAPADAAEETGLDVTDQDSQPGDQAGEADAAESTEESAGARRRRRRRRRAGVAEEMEVLSSDDPPNTVVKIRTARQAADEITSVRGSTRIEAKKQRRRDGRDAGRRRAPILTEAEFLARREAVDRIMCVRQRGDRTQIAVLEDGILVEHYVNRASSGSMVGNVHLGKVQNVLPSMEAAFVDIGRSRNAVLYAGEVNWDAAGLEGQAKRIELALKAGDPVLVQVTKDPLGHKGARLTSQISLPGRYLVYVPEGSMSGISRKLPDTERSRLKGILKEVLPEGAGVIVRTAAEGATEEQLTADVNRLSAQWADIRKKAKSATAPALLYGEPDLAIKVVRDIFNEDFHTLVVEGDDIWSTLRDYIGRVAPDLMERLSLWTGTADLFAAYRIDEQLAKALDRKVWLPSGGSLVIDRTEAMTVIDVNTGRFTGQGGNLEETVTRNNLEAAEEIVRQLRLRDIGGIVVVDFIDMVLENNRDLVLRRLVECLGRDRTRHQVAEVTSLGLVQMTRKRIGQGLLEVFSTPCEHCNGRGHVIHADPVALQPDESAQERRGDGRQGRGDSRGRGEGRSRRAANGPPGVAPLGGKQTGHTPPPPRLDELGHVAHEESDGLHGDDAGHEPSAGDRAEHATAPATLTADQAV